MHYFSCDYTLPNCKATRITRLLNRNTNTTNNGSCWTEGFPVPGPVSDTVHIWLSYLISRTSWWGRYCCYCHWSSGSVPKLPKVTQSVCGGAGLWTWPVVTPDPTFLVTGLFLFLPGQFRDVGQRMKGLVVSQELFCEWGECLLSEPSPVLQGACHHPSCNFWVCHKASQSSTSLSECNCYTCQAFREHLNGIIA